MPELGNSGGNLTLLFNMFQSQRELTERVKESHREPERERERERIRQRQRDIESSH